MSAAGDAALVASLFAVDPTGLGGVCLRSLAQPARTRWLEMLRDLLPSGMVMRRIPFNITDGRLLGGLDLVGTLRANRPIAERGVLAATDGGVVVVTMAERLSSHTAACLNAVLDAGEVSLQREGVDIHDRARVGIVALDESMAEDERVPTSLLDRMAFLIDLNGFDSRTLLAALHDVREIIDAQGLLPQVRAAPDIVSALCGTAMALGAGSMRVSLLALRAAKVVAALDGRVTVSEADAATAATLVFAPRATQIPQSPAAPAGEADAATEPQEPASDPPDAASDAPDPAQTAGATDAGANDTRDSAQIDADELDDIVLAAAQSAIPSGLLASLRGGGPKRMSQSASTGRVGALRSGGTRGRPAGVRSGAPQGHARLNVMETLRAAAPWQRLRGRVAQGDARGSMGDARVRIEPGDFRVTRYQQRSQTLTIFAVDASGSSAMNRLAEAKGAVELLLADCYVRRDQVAVVTFRGRNAQLLLPPTRSLVRAKRGLAGLPGGGGTPLAAAIRSALLVATQAQRRGDTPTLVMLTDGRANVAQDGTGGREQAHADALKAARQIRRSNITAMFVDTSPRPNPLSQELASAMNAHYIALPYASARALSSIVAAAAVERRAPARRT